MNARAYLHVYVRRGKVLKVPCLVCGTIEVESHHPDYSQPLNVLWLCKPHHRRLHRESEFRESVEQLAELASG